MTTIAVSIPATLRARCADLIDRSALSGCVTSTMGGAVVRLERDYDLLSPGEQLLVQALASVAAGDVAAIDIREIRDRVDAESYDAVVAASGVAA